MDDRTPVADLLAEADKGLNSKRIVVCNGNTLNTPYTAGLTSNANAGTAYINMTSPSHGMILYIASATFEGKSKMFLRAKTSGAWKDWVPVLTNQDLNHVELVTMSNYAPGDEINLLHDVKEFKRLIFLFGSPSSQTNGYSVAEICSWGLQNQNIGVLQPNIGMTVNGENALFRWLSDTKIKYVSGPINLRSMYGFKNI